MDLADKLIIGFCAFMILVNIVGCQHDVYQSKLCKEKGGEYHRPVCVKPEAIIKLD